MMSVSGPRFKQFFFMIVLLTLFLLVVRLFGTSYSNTSIIVELGRIDSTLRLAPNPNTTTARNTDSNSDKPAYNVSTYEVKPKTRPTAAQHLQMCKKETNVVFLKVHKAGSTTVMNIFLRFATSHKLNLVLPRTSSGFGFNYLGYGTTVSSDRIVPLPTNETYNILCNHVVYNRMAFRGIMPSDTKYVAILREPTSHFISAASYYGFFKRIDNLLKEQNITTEDPFLEFFKDPSSFQVGTYFVHNRMSFDFGLPQNQFENDTFFDSYIKQLNNDFDLVMVLEKFYESLVLMRRQLCWETRDILYVPLNERKSAKKFSFSAESKQLLKQWNKADYKLYDHFRAVFDKKLESHGQDLLDEVESFKQIQGKVNSFCESGSNDLLIVPATKWGQGFVVDLVTCQEMMEPELSTMRRLIEEAWLRFNDSVAQ